MNRSAQLKQSRVITKQYPERWTMQVHIKLENVIIAVTCHPNLTD